MITDNKDTSIKGAEINSCEDEKMKFEEKDTEKDRNIDHGWAWVIVAAATASFCVFASSLRGFGVFFNGFIDKFDSSSSITSSITGIMHATYSIFSFAFSFLHGPLAYLVGIYFIKRRNLAQAITISGGQLGGLLFPPLYGYLIREYGLQDGMLLTGGIHLNIIALAILLRPKRINIMTLIQGKIDSPHVSTSNISERKQMIENNDDKMMASNGMFNGMKRSSSETYWHFILFSIATGISAGGIFALTPTVVADFMGIDNFRSAMGILVLFQGVSLAASGPFLGYLKDVSGTYVTSFYFLGGCDILSALIFIIGLVCIRKLKEKSISE
ncbi:unnamed protein product [Mytilus edulis]|uniref:Uncharacterized protein n=1 Tax=Mytilus edulis TaxID=6550 RepID=A0A8S3T6R7_MYTED|nr:unnamed protein product [Mytilus edulis]